jgi:hypothetical protein
MKQLNALITNTTSLVGYIAILMFAGAYLGGDARDMPWRISTLDPTLLKGSLSEYSRTPLGEKQSPIIITINGRQYEAMLGKEVNEKPIFQY